VGLPRAHGQPRRRRNGTAPSSSLPCAPNIGREDERQRHGAQGGVQGAGRELREREAGARYTSWWIPHWPPQGVWYVAAVCAVHATVLLTMSRSSPRFTHRLEPPLSLLHREEGRRRYCRSRRSLWQWNIRERYLCRPEQASRTT
jgi:hypothetical protein